METDETRPRGLPAGAVVGTTIGVFGWWLGLCVVLLLSGSTDLMLRLLPEGFALTAGLCAALLLVVRVARPGSGPFQLSLWCGMLLTVGVLLLYCRHAVMPALLADPDIYELLGRTGSITTVPSFSV